MVYVLDIAPLERSVLKQIIRDGSEVPDKFKNKPELRQGLLFYLEAFYELDSDRQRGEIEGPIPWSSIIRYAEYYELDEEQTSDLLYFVRKLDDVHINRLIEKRKQG